MSDAKDATTEFNEAVHESLSVLENTSLSSAITLEGLAEQFAGFAKTQRDILTLVRAMYDRHPEEMAQVHRRVDDHQEKFRGVFERIGRLEHAPAE